MISRLGGSGSRGVGYAPSWRNVFLIWHLPLSSPVELWSVCYQPAENVGDEQRPRVITGDWSAIVYSLLECLSLHQMALSHEAPQGRPSALGSWSSAQPVRHAIFDHGSESPTTERSREYPFLAECRHRRHEPRKGGLGRNTSQSRFWFCQYYFVDDQGTFPLLRLPITGSRVIRIPWLTKPNMSSLG